MLIESEDPGGSEILCVHLDMQTVSKDLEMTQMPLGSQVDTPKGPTDTRCIELKIEPPGPRR